MNRWVLLLLTVTGCQCLVPVDEVGAADAAVPTTPLLAFCAAVLPTSVCGQAHACGVAAPDASCEELLNPRGNHYGEFCSPRLLSDLDAGVLVFDADAGRACLERLATVCGPARCISSVFRGTMPVGFLCKDLECAPGLYCDGVLSCRGLCVGQREDGAEPETIAGCLSDEAVDLKDGGLRCCRKAGALGVSCPQAADEISPAPCAPGLACLSGTCSTPLSEGARCSPSAFASECGHGLACDPQGSTCVRWARLGEPCGVGCLRGLSCDPARHVCAPLPGEGASCAVSKVCAPPLGCQAGQVCVRLGREGEPCSHPLDCETPFKCSGGQCHAGVPVGGACMIPYDCAEGLDCVSGRCGLNQCL